jgi:hypothetical protein
MSVPMRYTALALLGGALLPLLQDTPAAAVVVNVGGIFYDVSITNMSHTLSPTSFALPPLGQMPWWGDDARASEFATSVFLQLGPGTDANYGPVFAYAVDTALNQVLGLSQSLTDIDDQIDVMPTTSATTLYATASSTSTTPVPLSLPILGAATGFGWSRRLRQRLRQRSIAVLPLASLPPAN